MKAEVTFTDSAIASVTVTEHSETEGIADGALEKIPGAGAAGTAAALSAAEQIGVPGTAFLESVEQYNTAAETGKDELFFADGDRLIPVKEGPFYAVKFVCRNLGTLGGVRVDENLRAVDKLGAPVPNLYVAGADAGGMYGKSYVDFEGGTLGFAYTSGRIAGLSAAEELK